MGNKTSKKKEAAPTAVAKHQFSTSYRAPGELSAQQHDGPEWVMVVNATAYIRCGSLGAGTSSGAPNIAPLLSGQASCKNRAVVGPTTNAITQHGSSSNSVIGNHPPQRQAVTIAAEALDLLKDDNKSRRDYFLSNSTTAIAKPNGAVSGVVRQQTCQTVKHVQRECTAAKAHPLEAKSHIPAVNCNTNNNIIPQSRQNFGANKPTTIVSSQNSSATKKSTVTVATTSTAVTVYNSAVRKDHIKTLLTASEEYDWFNTLTTKGAEKQQAVSHTRKEPPLLQLENKPQAAKNTQFENNTDARAQEGFMWRQVNSAERGCWYHFRRAGGRYKCTLCNVFLPGPQSVIEHAWGKFHQANLGMKRANETEEDLMWRQVPKPEKFHRNYIYETTEGNKSLFYCSICDVDVPFVYQNLLTHIRGRNHCEQAKFQ